VGALSGIRILELCRVPPGEYCTMLLADLGAEVMKIETPGRAALGGRTRFDYLNRNKRSLTLDLKSEPGREILRSLAGRADVLVEGFRPGVMKRLGVGYEVLSELNPSLVYCAMSGYGQDGPYRDRPGHDLNFIALAGILGLIGKPDELPAIPLNLIADYGGASLHAALGIACALIARGRSGKGQFVDIAYLDTAISLGAATPSLRHVLSRGDVPERGVGYLYGEFPYNAIYGTADGKLITVACTEPHLWHRFCEAIGRPDLKRFERADDHFSRRANAGERAARGEVDAIMRRRSRDEWNLILAAADVCVGSVHEPQEIADDPQVKQRSMVVELEDPEAGRARQFGIAIKLGATPGSIRSLAPMVGEHSEDILREIGLDADAIAALREQRVI